MKSSVFYRELLYCFNLGETVNQIDDTIDNKINQNDANNKNNNINNINSDGDINNNNNSNNMDLYNEYSENENDYNEIVNNDDYMDNAEEDKALLFLLEAEREGDKNKFKGKSPLSEGGGGQPHSVNVKNFQRGLISLFY